MFAEISIERIVARSLSKSGIVPMFANSSSRQRTCTGSLPPYLKFAVSYSVSNSCVYIIAAKKLNVASEDGMITNSAVFLSPRVSRWILSVKVRFPTSGRLNACSRTAAEIRIDFAVSAGAFLKSL